MKNLFCPKCKNLMAMGEIGEKHTLKCSKCGFLMNLNGTSLKTTEKLKQKFVGQGVVDGKNELADYEHKCKKCGYDKAQIVDMGIFYSDEDNLILLKCGKCGNSERIGRKTN